LAIVASDPTSTNIVQAVAAVEPIVSGKAEKVVVPRMARQDLVARAAGQVVSEQSQ